MGTPQVEFRHITKRFPGIVALHDVSLTVAAGSCHGLVGENGAGKSTLGKVLAGLHLPDAGELLVGGRPVRLSSPLQALQAGVGMVHQELAFCENMTVAENLCLDRLPHVAGWLSRSQLEVRAKELLAPIAADLDISRRVGDLPVSQQQLVQIAAAVGRGARIIVFDEPTSSLSEIEARRLHALIRQLQQQGVTCIYISHRLPEVFALCDTVTVLRDGRVVTTQPVAQLSEDAVVALMIGRRLEEYFPQHLAAAPGEELLGVQGLSSPGKFRDITLSLRAGEVVGIAGLVGAGRTELAEAIFGLDPAVRGEVRAAGQPLPLTSPRQALARGVGLVPEDRKRHALVLSMTARENLTLPLLERLSRLGWVNRRAEGSLVRETFRRLRVRAPGPEVAAAALSGGNQQKLVLARWLAARCQVLLLDEPTRGVDVGAKAEIHGLIDDLARSGSAILLISSELPEILNLSTRILVMREGRLVGELARDQATAETVLRLMAGLPGS
ncbi:MAG: sugar ABC transporter ATP-binding protein [Armatimonadetes bacterium]|nr:sugar ABC transporter ATP-binding protein [Armatimonadota bacterium]